MNSKEQIDELISVQSGILVDCFLIAKDIEFLSTENQPKEIADVIEGDRFFIRSGNYMWTILILELNKLYDKKESYALEKTLNISINNQKNISWKKPDNLDRIIDLRTRLQSPAIQSVVSNIGHIRDKQSAHLDRNRLSKEVLLHISEAKQLLNLAQDIVSEISIALNGIQLGLDFEFLGLSEMTVKKLAEYNRILE